MQVDNGQIVALDCGKPPCPEHQGLCAYHGTEPDRCPFCHSTWRAILATGDHSCERPAVWTNGKRPNNAVYVASRIAQARALRERADERPQGPWQSGHCAHGYSDAPQRDESRAKAQNASGGRR